MRAGVHVSALKIAFFKFHLRARLKVSLRNIDEWGELARDVRKYDIHLWAGDARLASMASFCGEKLREKISLWVCWRVSLTIHLYLFIYLVYSSVLVSQAISKQLTEC
jgi:hypothetical protein